VAKKSSQKFIGRNRAPRVQIEYDVEVYGSEKKIQLPFVMGVLADLSGKPEVPLPAVADRKFLEIDVDNFDQRMKAMKPRVAFPIRNTLTGEGNLLVDITFESLDDFSPAAIARKVEPLRRLLEMRTQLANLMTYMDGKSGAEDLIGKMLRDPALLQQLGSAPNPAAARAAEAPVAEPVEAPNVSASSDEANGEGENDEENLDSLLDQLK
jgi:type VI secretion system protein ImpB